jgi:hypothetical protein
MKDIKVITVEVTITKTSIKTRFRATTEQAYIKHKDTLTTITTVYSDTLIDTVVKTNLYRYKEITTETEAGTDKSSTLTKIKTNVIPSSTVTEFKESDKRVTRAVITHS